MVVVKELVCREVVAYREGVALVEKEALVASM